MTDDIRALARAINRGDADPTGESVGLRRGVVTAVNAGTGTYAASYTVTVGGVTLPVGIPAYSHVRPFVGDSVDILFDGPSPRIVGIVSPLVWHYVGAVGEPPFLNGWRNFSNLGGVINPGAGEGSVRFARDAMGFVHLDGMASSGVVGQAVFALPVGYRPEQRSNFPALSNSAFGIVVIEGAAQGSNVLPYLGSNGYFQFSGMTFLSA